jgi:hypothetical protein
MKEDTITKFLETLAQGVTNCQSTGIFFAQHKAEDVYLSCYQDYVSGIPSTCSQFQQQPTNQFTWFMSKIYATKTQKPEERLIISDYAIIPEEAPLKQYYPPFFKSVADYVLWDNQGAFVGWIGLLSTDQPIDWETHRAFITKTITDYEATLLNAYANDFLTKD